MATSILVSPTLANAAVPEFPDNLVIFPNRDMVVMEGFDSLTGSPVTIEVYGEDGKLKGQASGTPAAGAEFEVNHPGGVCWGAGAGATMQVTPNIDGGDRVVLRSGTPGGNGAEIADTIVQDIEVLGSAGGSGATVTVQSRIGAGVNKAQLEARIINPDLTDTAIGRRDVRALPGTAPVLAEKGGYDQFLNTTTGLATYIFEDEANATIARSGGGERIMGWQTEDADGNRQGLTIAEAGEPGGAGMGGCPAGPNDVGAPAPGDASYFVQADGSLQVHWTPAEPIAGASAVVGYQVLALGAPNATGEQATFGVRTGKDAKAAVVTGTAKDATYTVEVRSLTANGALSGSLPVTKGNPTTPTTPPTDGDKTAPSVTPSATSPVTFSGLGADEEIYYTLDGSAPNEADAPSLSASLYKDAGIPIPAGGATLRWFAIDASGNYTTDQKTYAATVVEGPGAPTGVSATAGELSANVTWTAPGTTGSSAISKYVVTAAPATGTTVTKEFPASPTSGVVTGLTAGVEYSVTVVAHNAAGAGTASTVAKVTPTAVLKDRVTIASARWRTGELRVVGTASNVGGTVEIVRASNNTVIGRVAVTAAVAPATGGEYDYRLRAASMNTFPGQIYARTVNTDATKVGQSAPVTPAR